MLLEESFYKTNIAPFAVGLSQITQVLREGEGELIGIITTFLGGKW